MRTSVVHTPAIPKLVPGAAIAFVLSIIIFAGCSDELPTGPDGGAIMPLKSGNMWIGQRRAVENGGAVTRDTIAVIAEQKREGKSWYRIEGYPTECFDGPEWMRNGPLGLQVDTLGCACGGVRAKYPAQVGDRFAMMPPALVLLPDQPDPVEQVVGRQVLATDSVITVPAGTFSCYVYKQVLFSPENATFIIPPPVEFYAPEVGIVRIDLYSSTGEIESMWELVEAKLR